MTIKIIQQDEIGKGLIVNVDTKKLELKINDDTLEFDNKERLQVKPQKQNRYIRIHDFFTQDDMDNWEVIDGSNVELALENFALKIGANNGSDNARIACKTLYPVQDDVIYKLTVSYKKLFSGGQNYMGVLGLADDKKTFVNRNGANAFNNQFYPFNSADEHSNSYEVVLHIAKHDVDLSNYQNAMNLHENVKYFRPFFVANYVASGISYLDYFKVEIV